MMLKQGKKATRKENWQHRSESAVVQGHFGSQQVSAVLWSTHTRWIWSSCYWSVVEGTLSQTMLV